MAQVAPFFGVMPAPADMNATAAEKKAHEITGGHIRQGARTKEQFEKSQLEHKIENALRKGDPEAARMINQAKQDKAITPKDMQAIRKSAKTPPIVNAIRQFDFSESMQVWDQADDQEKAKLKRSILQKGMRYLETHPGRRAETQTALKEVRRFSGGR